MENLFATARPLGALWTDRVSLVSPSGLKPNSRKQTWGFKITTSKINNHHSTIINPSLEKTRGLPPDPLRKVSQTHRKAAKFDKAKSEARSSWC
jgi:hypothetical protein